MKHLFLDTNVLIDFLTDRKPHSIHAARLFNDALHKKIVIYISAVSFNNMYYILRQSNAHTNCIQCLSELQEWSKVIDVTSSIISSALGSGFRDFEDAIQYHCAKSINKIDAIITRNSKDYKLSAIQILSPAEAVSMIAAP
jgi:predicted nucleic acid-binding protein